MKTRFLVFFLGLTFFVTSCQKEDDIDYTLFSQNIESNIQNGGLLMNVRAKGDDYLFVFEKTSMSIPQQFVREVKTDIEQWRTTVTYNNGSSYIIPSKGTDISGFIVNTIVNPSHYCPLAARVVVNLPVTGRMKVVVHSKENATTPNVEYYFKSIEKGQTLDILGLYQNYSNRVTLIYTDLEEQERGRTTITIPVGKLNLAYLPMKIKVVNAELSKTEPGMTLISSPGESEADTSIPYFLDMDGEIRWVADWSQHPQLKNIGAQGGLQRLKNGNYIVGDGNNHLLAEINLLGEIVRKWDLNALGYTYHHEVSQSENGNYLVAVTKNSAKLSNGLNSRIYDHIIEFNPVTSAIVKEWDLTTMLDSSRYTPIDPSQPGASFGQTQSNWCHNNAVSSWGNNYLANARFQGVFKYGAAGDVKWVISPHKGWRDKFNRYLLQPVKNDGTPITDQDVILGNKSSDDFEWSWGGHNPVLMPNGHILVFDNGYGRHFDMTNQSGSKLYSRIVEYEVDEEKRTVRQVWQYGKERGQECYAAALSSVQYLPVTGNRLFCPGMGCLLSDGYHGARVIELNAQTGEVVFEMEIVPRSMTAFHRAKRMALYPD